MNHREFRVNIYVVYEVYWFEVPDGQERRVTRRNEASPGRAANTGDYV